MQKEIEILKEKYGTYSQTAKVLGITPRHFRRIRNDHLKPSKPLKKLMLLNIQELESNEPEIEIQRE